MDLSVPVSFYNELYQFINEIFIRGQIHQLVVVQNNISLGIAVNDAVFLQFLQCALKMPVTGTKQFRCIRQAFVKIQIIFVIHCIAMA